MSLANPAFSSANTMGANDVGLGQKLAGIEENKGDISAQLAANPFTSASGLLNNATSMINPEMLKKLFASGGGQGAGLIAGDPSAALLGLV
jgi:hypothetical protein